MGFLKRLRALNNGFSIQFTLHEIRNFLAGLHRKKPYIAVEAEGGVSSEY